MAPRFRLMTTNLLHEHVDLGDLAAVLDRVAPDVVVAQELSPDGADLLASAYPNHRLDPSLDFTGRGIATRLDVVFDDIEMPGRDGTAALLEVGEEQVRLAGVHLVNPIHFPWWVTAKVRGMQVDALFDWVDAAEGPLLVAGDLNASPAWRSYRRVGSRLTDLVADHAAANGAKAERTWAWRPGWPRMLRIDHVFGREVKAKDVSVEPIVGTDHWAVVVDLQIESPA